MTEASNLAFDSYASGWDNNPDIHKASDDALTAILKEYPQLVKAKEDGKASQSGYDVLEIGCGTGLLSFRLAPYVKSLIAVDSSHGMIDALQQKLDKLSDSPRNVYPLEVMLEDPEDPKLPPAKEGDTAGPRRKFDLVISHLVLHHIPDLPLVLRTMLGSLKEGGTIALTDYEDEGPWSRKFHPENLMEGVERHGIKRQEFFKQIEEAGFKDVQITTGWTMTKGVEKFPGEWASNKPPASEQEMADFPFLFCTAKKI